MKRPMAGATRRPSASSTSQRGKSAPAAIVSGMPPENRGLISNTVGRPSTIRHWMLIGAREREHLARTASARSISAGSRSPSGRDR